MLSLALGMTVRELLARIDSHELSEWIEYYKIDPFGNARSDLQSGIVAATIANANRAKNTQSYQPMDFMPLQEKPKQEESDMQEVMNKMARGNSGNSR